jgi:hypothetical protein
MNDLTLHRSKWSSVSRQQEQAFQFAGGIVILTAVFVALVVVL